jgi:hypothetical protein
VCLARFTAAFCRSHSNSSANLHYTRGSEDPWGVSLVHKSLPMFQSRIFATSIFFPFSHFPPPFFDTQSHPLILSPDTNRRAAAPREVKLQNEPERALARLRELHLRNWCPTYRPCPWP